MRCVKTKEDYVNLKKEAEKYLGLVVHFRAEWCEPCKHLSEVLEGYLPRYKEKVLIAEVDADLLGTVCEMEDVECVPFVIYFRTSQPNRIQERVAEVVGCKVDLIDMNMVSLYGDGSVTRDSFSDLNEYLNYLTTRKGVVAFITGTPSKPRCGFTSRLVEMFFGLGVKFIYYDVWSSEEVCEGIKRYSEWPTFPQIYVDGELIGGFDICSQLNDAGELKAILKQ